MRNKKHSKNILALAAVFAASAVMSAALPLSASAAATYSGLTDSANNATEFTKQLELKDNVDIPEVSFDYAVTVPAAATDAVYDTETEALVYPAVLPGPTPENIKFSVKKSDGSGDYTALAGNGSFDLDYAAQSVTLPTPGESVGADDNVLIYNKEYDDAVYNGGTSNIDSIPYRKDMDTYYACKTVKLDFSDCDFKEPGVYRYYIKESGDNAGVVNDYKNLDDDGSEKENVTCWRTIDVFVEDATYTPAGETEPVNKLSIASCNMYVGKVDGAPASDNVKSDSIRNIYDTSDLTFRKEIEGNQASRDKFFKFTVKLTGADDVIDDDDTFVIAPESNQVVNSGYKGKTATPNAATKFSMGDIYTANAVNVDAPAEASGDASGDTSGTPAVTPSEPAEPLPDRTLTGKQLKDGYTFYLQGGQFVTIKNLPNGVGYEITEEQDGYTPTVKLLSTETDGSGNIVHAYDNAVFDNASNPNLGVIIGGDNDFGTSRLTVDNNTAKIADNEITADVDATFKNTRSGILPTGVLLSIGGPALIAILLIGAIVFLVIRNRRRQLEGE